LWDRVTMDVEIKDWKKFVNWLSKILPNNNTIHELINKVITDYNSNKFSFEDKIQVINYPILYFLNNWKILEIFNYLERKWQLSIVSIDNVFSKENFDNRKPDIYLIEIKYKPKVFNLKKWVFNLYLKENNIKTPIKDIEDIVKLVEIDKWYKLHYKDKCISFNKWSLRYRIIKTIFKDKYKKWILFWDLYYEVFNEDYSYLNNKKEASSIRSAVSWINRDFNKISKNQNLLMFEENTLIKEKIK